MGRVQQTGGQETHPLFPFCLTIELDPLLFSCSWIGIYISGSPGSQDFELGLNYTMGFPGSSLMAQLVKNLPAMQETLVQFLSWEDLLEKG